jgi:cobalt/nickel transport system permease protein
MHIPDGYLSPSTCTVGYAAAAPFWYFALRRVKNLLNTRLVPLIAVFSAFCFVIMMFNLPIPGGTTAHAIGVGIAAIVLGPWAAILAVSIALLIQAVFFGDGGITSYAFNCINMGIVGAWVAYGVYRLIAARAALTSRRRVVAAAIAGYLAINAGAFCAAVEFGVQPIFFHTASGAPLYAPYPLSVSIPAMMVAHLTLAGVAELVVSAGIVAWLQRANPALLRFTAQGAAPDATSLGDLAARGAWRATRRLWLIVGALMILAPLGLLAAASAWGEWGAGDFASSSGRATIASQSLHHATPTQAPPGLKHLASFWTAPMPDYAPAFMHSAAFGYILSAVVGGGLIILAFFVIAWIAGRFGSGGGNASPRRPSSGRGHV